MSTIRGTVKIQCITLPIGKHLIPQLLFIEDRVWRPCSLPHSSTTKLDEGQVVARLAFEAEMNATCWVIIDNTLHERVRLFDDGSGLYECEVEDADQLRQEDSFEHRNHYLRLHHHTGASTVPEILASGRLNASPWNYEGSTKLEETNFVYFTDLPAINDEEDLRAVAMSNGNYRIGLRYDDPRMGIEELSVPIRPTREFDGSIVLLVDPGLIDPQPMLLHDQNVSGEGVALYWELLNQHIFRIPVAPGGFVGVTEQDQQIGKAQVQGLQLKKRIIAGSAFLQGELRVVFDEGDLTKYELVTQSAACDPFEWFYS